ncbi:hypothetical protein M9H77_27669 [Catharanthus roseus]|uniref:Uncharacterized protein n=1 Tax=Catharanthus roseus TaxID=4058 RepID=A0ACC0AHA8_CATRO|nr:hypothetical protein M9H77_27669 [Catharanthus roseus]
MEEVPAHVHPGPIVPYVLSRQHKHQFGLIWSGDHKTCYTDLQCRRFRRNIFQCYSTTPRRQLCTAALGGARQIGGALVLVQICMVAYICIAASADYLLLLLALYGAHPLTVANCLRTLS